MLPKFVERMLDGPQEWEVQDLDVATIENLEYRIIDPENLDESEELLFTDDYNSKAGVFCFRGNAQRNAPTRGTLNAKPSKVRVDWVFTTATDNRNTEFGSWAGGSGWTGQPLVVKWPKEVKHKLFDLAQEHISDDNFKEVTVGSLCGNIYFLDWKTGLPTRQHMTISNPIKGTVSLDPRMNGLLYVGQGIPNGERFGSYVFDLFTGKEIYFRNGLDPDARRDWGAFDSNPLIDSKTGRWIQPAENGQIYVAKVDQDQTIYKPAKFNYIHTTHPDFGLEASFGAWNNLGYFGDNVGNVFCLNLMNMKPVWWIDNYDDTDASMVIDIQEDKHPFLYVGNEVDKQGPEGLAHIRKIDGLTGKELWSIERSCRGTAVGGRVNSGGVLASVLPGKNKASDLVYGIFSRVNGTMAGEFVAINKKTGKEAFVIKMDFYSWASPIDLYDKEGNCYIFFTDVYGNIYLIDGLTGDIIYKERMDCVWESSPVAWGNRIVVGSRGNKIYSFIVE